MFVACSHRLLCCVVLCAIPRTLVHTQMQRMIKYVGVPVLLAHTHMLELVQMAAGTTSPVKLQLVLLPPHACDITPGKSSAVRMHGRNTCVSNATAGPVKLQLVLLPRL